MDIWNLHVFMSSVVTLFDLHLMVIGLFSFCVSLCLCQFLLICWCATLHVILFIIGRFSLARANNLHA